MNEVPADDPADPHEILAARQDAGRRGRARRRPHRVRGRVHASCAPRSASRSSSRRRIKPMGWTWPGFRVLFWLWLLGPLEPRQIADVVQLVARERLQRAEHPRAQRLRRAPARLADRRLVNVELTEKGAERMAEAFAAANRTRAGARRGLSAEERRTLTELLGVLAVALTIKSLDGYGRHDDRDDRDRPAGARPHGRRRCSRGRRRSSPCSASASPRPRPRDASSTRRTPRSSRPASTARSSRAASAATSSACATSSA